VWAVTGVVAYFWKAGMTATIYSSHFRNFEQSRQNEIKALQNSQQQ
jgi:hypothetical protein